MSKKLYHQFTCSSMILPEHRNSLRRCREQSSWEEEHRRPELDEQEQERFQQALERSMQEGIPLRLTVLNKHGYRSLVGNVVKLEPWSGRLRLRTAGGMETVKVDQVTGIEPHPPGEENC